MNTSINKHFCDASPIGIFRLGKNRFLARLLIAMCAGGGEAEHGGTPIAPTGTGNSPVVRRKARHKTTKQL